MCVCVKESVCAREKKKERERACVCVCEREKERERVRTCGGAHDVNAVLGEGASLIEADRVQPPRQVHAPWRDAEDVRLR